MVTKQSLLLEVDLETGQVVSSIEQLDGSFKDLDKSVEKTSDGVATMTGHLDKMTGGAISSFKGMAGGISSAVKGMKSFKVALASTGIGLLIVAVGSLVTYFTKTQRGAEFLEKATASLGAVFAVFTDAVSGLGETLMGAFSNPLQAIQDFGNSIKEYVLGRVQLVMDSLGLLGSAISKLFEGDFSGAASDAAQSFVALNRGINPVYMAMEAVVSVAPDVINAVTEVGNRAAEAASKAAALAQRSIDLRAAQRDLRVEMAESRAQFKEYNAIAEDTTKTTEERLAAANKAIDLEKTLMAERQRLAAEEVAIQKEKMALSENTEEDYERLAELETNLINIREEAAERLTTVTNKRNIIEQQALKEEEDRYARMTELDNALSTAKEQEIAALVEEYETKFALAEEFGYGEQELMVMQKEAIAAIEQKYLDEDLAKKKKAAEDEKKVNDQRIADEQRVRDAKFKLGLDAIGALMALNDAFAKGDTASQKKAFKRNKAFSIAQAVISTAQGISQQLAVPKDQLTGQNFVKAGIVAAMGVAQIAKISSAKFQAGGATGGVQRPELPGSVGEAAPQQATGLIDFSFLNRNQEQPVQAYVVAQQVTTSQQASQQIQDQAALVG